MAATALHAPLPGTPIGLDRFIAGRYSQNMMNAQESQSMESGLREMAERNGFVLHRNRTRDPQAVDYGRYHLADAGTGIVIVGGGGPTGYSLTLDDVAAYLDDSSGSAPPVAARANQAGRIARVEEALPETLRLKAVSEFITRSGQELETSLLAWEYRAWRTPERRAALDAHLAAMPG
ncbi:hypothetical protein O1L68_42280 [Streptomyces lydicus]|nr:hypothetical protein [Streptomyces lydicus]